jgi:hypothetical protein
MKLIVLLMFAMAQPPEERIGMLAMGKAGERVESYATEPGTGAKRMLRWKTEASVEEYAYEDEGLVVYERKQEWVRVKLKQGSAWIQIPQGGKFLPLEELLVETLTFLTKEWDGKLAKTAGGVMGPKLKTEVEPTVKVVGNKRIDGKLWVNLAIYDASPCEVATPKVIARGWVPARVVWFYSRGC